MSDVACPECRLLLRDQGPSGDPWELQVQCPGCSSIYHISCTVMDSDRMWRRLGRYAEKWKCKRCFIDGSEESVAFLEYIKKLKNVSERPPNSETSSRSKSRSDQSCAECLKELRDENGRLSRRVQCLDCLDVFHFSCTEFGDENIWQRVGNYRNRWKCKNCSGFDSDSVILREKLNEVKRSLDIPVNIV